MNFIETRGNDTSRKAEVTFSEAILNPSASFGGLYVPKELPKLEKEFILNHTNSTYKELAYDILKAFEIDIKERSAWSHRPPSISWTAAPGK